MTRLNQMTQRFKARTNPSSPRQTTPAEKARSQQQRFQLGQMIGPTYMPSGPNPNRRPGADGGIRFDRPEDDFRAGPGRHMSTRFGRQR